MLASLRQPGAANSCLMEDSCAAAALEFANLIHPTQ